MNMPYRGMFIVPSDLESLERKGVIAGVLERTEEGFLEVAVTVHPFVRQERTVCLAEDSIVYEYRQPEQSAFRPVSWMRFLAHIFHVVWRVRKICRTQCITFIRAQDPYYSGLIGFLASRFPRIPFCISIHSDYDKMYTLDPEHGAPKVFGRRHLAKKLESFLLKRADRVLVISDYIGDCAARNGARSDSLRLFRHIVGLKQFLETAAHGATQLPKLPPNKIVISAICRLSRQKYVYDILELAKKLRSKRDDFVVVLAGGGEEEHLLRHQIKQDGLSQYVLMPGFLPQPAVAALRMRSTVNLCLLDGQSLIEACSVGKPVVAYDVEWHREILCDKVTGFIVPESDVDRLVESAIYLMDHPKEAKRMGELARQRVFKMFDPERVRSARRSIYEELVAHFRKSHRPYLTRWSRNQAAR